MILKCLLRIVLNIFVFVFRFSFYYLLVVVTPGTGGHPAPGAGRVGHFKFKTQKMADTKAPAAADFPEPQIFQKNTFLFVLIYYVVFYVFQLIAYIIFNPYILHGHAEKSSHLYQTNHVM